jgi:hypothetical protein
MSLANIETVLLSGTELDGMTAERIRAGRPGEPRTIPETQMRVLGSARGVGEHEGYGTEYLLVNLGREERIVARYSGPVDLLAYNRSVFRRSLTSLQATRLLTLPVSAGVDPAFEPVDLDPGRCPSVPLPAGWTREDLLPEEPLGLPAPDAALAASPQADFSVVFRVFWWHVAPSSPEAAAAAVVSAAGGNSGGPAYARHDRFLGMGRIIQGQFRQIGGGLLLLESRAPLAKSAFIEDLRLEWLSRAPQDAHDSSVPGR